VSAAAAVDTHTADALDLLNRGWHPVPVEKGAKYPPQTGRTGVEGVDMTTQDVEAHDWSGSSIAVRTPATVIGIDVDAYKGGLDTSTTCRPSTERCR
jgi:hypothetical protein